MEELPFSQACENNKQPILDVLQEAFADRKQVLEVGSGTGQHATFFAQAMPHLTWQPAELAENRSMLHRRCALYEGSNLRPEITVDVRAASWPVPLPDAVFSANTLHIMSLGSVKRFFGGIGEGRPDDFKLAIYGPFNYAGAYTSESNARFDQWLAQQNPESAIRDFETVNQLAREAGLTLVDDKAMPANNRLLYWQSR